MPVRIELLVYELVSYADDLLPLVVGGLAVAGLSRFETPDRDLLARAGLATVGSAFVAYGLREVLRAWGGGYYCCNHAFYAAVGLLTAGVGWVFVVAALRSRSFLPS